MNPPLRLVLPLLTLPFVACNGAPGTHTTAIDEFASAPHTLLAPRTIAPAEIRGAVRLL